MSIRVPVKLYKEDPSHRMPKTHLTAEVYAAAIGSFVIVCVDAIVVNRNRRTVFLTKRRIKPMQGLWIIGGRMQAGELWTDAIRRKFRQEAWLDIPAERFEFLRINQYQWKDRRQEPQDTGSDNLALTFAVELTDAEIAGVSEGLDPDEYEPDFGLREFDRPCLVAAGAHPAILDLYDQLFQS